MRKIYLLVLSTICLCSLSAYGASPCDSEQGYTPQNRPSCQQPCQKPCKKEVSPCKKPCEKVTPCKPACNNPSDKFLCTCKTPQAIFSAIGMSETQVCTAMKIQDKYQLEVLSLNERIQCEKETLCKMKKSCTTNSEIRRQKKVIKNLEKEKKKICKNYECQFKAILSDPQKKSYKKAKK